MLELKMVTFVSQGNGSMTNFYENTAGTIGSQKQINSTKDLGFGGNSANQTHKQSQKRDKLPLI